MSEASLPPKGQVLVAVDEFADAPPIGFDEVLDVEGAVDDGVLERCFGMWTDLAGDHVHGLSDHHRGGDERAGVDLQQLAAHGVVPVVAIDGCDQRTRINDQHDGRRSVSAEPVSEQLLDAVADPVPRRPDASERKMSPLRRGGFDEQFDGELFDTDAARRRRDLEPLDKLVWHVQRD